MSTQIQFGRGFGIKRIGYNEALGSMDKFVAGLPVARRNTLEDACKFFVDTAKPRIHHITHKTEKSTKTERVTDKYGVISSSFGAPHEEQRKGAKHGTSHMFMTYAATLTHKQFPIIIHKHITDLLNRSKSSVR